eukprot:Nk52_evm31s32 gene=Nk52_evmTU31s32
MESENSTFNPKTTSSRTKIIVISIAVLVVVGLGLGLGLYYGLDSGSSGSDNVASSTATIQPTSDIITSSDNPTSSSEVPSSSSVITTTAATSSVVTSSVVTSSVVTTTAVTTTVVTTTAEPTTATTSSSTPTSPSTPTATSSTTATSTGGSTKIPVCQPGEKVVSSSGDGNGHLSCESGEYATGVPGTQSYEGHTSSSLANQCMARVDVPVEVLEVAYKWAIPYYKDNGMANWSHDYTERTGRDTRGNAYTKSFVLTECNLTGHVLYDSNDEPYWQQDPSYPNIATTLSDASMKVGPEVWPEMSYVDVADDSDICNGEKCCISSDHVQSPATTFGGWASFSKSLHYLCQPVYKVGEEDSTVCDNAVGFGGENLINCGYYQIENKGTSFETSCSCLYYNSTQDEVDTYGGVGLDCTDINPGGKFYEQQGWDLFKSFSWALNQYYKKTGLCGGVGNVQYQQLCNPKNGACNIPYQPGVQLSYENSWTPGGRW